MSKVVKILGMIWKIKEDVISLATTMRLNIGDKLTKRSMLKIMASVYDPLGLFVPVTLRPKLLIQMLWKRKIEWDDLVPQEIVDEWNNIYGDLLMLSDINIKWCIDIDGIKKESIN